MIEDFARDVLHCLKVARLTGWRELPKAIIEFYKADQHYEILMGLPLDRISALARRNAACRALGLPDDWVYDESELKTAQAKDRLTRFVAIDHLVEFERNRAWQWRLREEKRECKEAAA